jgi:hypothetical protein
MRFRKKYLCIRYTVKNIFIYASQVLYSVPGPYTKRIYLWFEVFFVKEIRRVIELYIVQVNFFHSISQSSSLFSY